MAYNKFGPQNVFSGAVVGDETLSIENVDTEYRVFQRDGNNELEMSFDVTHSGISQPLKYRLVNAFDTTDATPYTVFNASPTDGVTTLAFTRASTKGMILVEVSTDDGSTTAIQTKPWVVGADVGLCGQSLAHHLGSQGDSGTPDDVYKYDSTNGFYKSGTGAGQAALGAKLVELLGCTVALTNTAVSGRCMTTVCGAYTGQGSDVWANENGAVFTNKITQLNGAAPDGRLEFELFIQGQSDAVAAVTEADYIQPGGTGGLESYVIETRARWKGKDGGPLPFIMGTLGRNNTTGEDGNAQVIREALLNFIDSDDDIKPLSIYPYATDDGTHPDNAGDLALGETAAYVYNGSEAPAVSSITLNGDRDAVVLTFNKDLAAATSYSLEGVRVVASDNVLSLESFTRTGTRTAEITLSEVLADATDVDVFLQWGTGTTSDLLSYPRAASADALYALPVYSKSNSLSTELPNTPPTANAGTDLPTVTAGAQFQLNGSGVANQAGAAIVGYSWAQISTGTAVALSNSLINNPTGVAPSTDTAQTLTYELTVTDSNGLTATDTVSVPIAAAVVAAESSNLSVTIKGSGSGVYEVSIFEISDLSTVIYNGDATFSNDVMTVDVDIEAGIQVVGLWVGGNFPNSGGSFEGVTG